MLKSKIEHRKSEPRVHSYNYNDVSRPPSSLSVCGGNTLKMVPMAVTAATCPPSPAVSALTLTPGRTRNLDQDMEALRMSRQDNPFVQRLIASRESLDCLEESSSDDTILMSQEFSSDLDADPFNMPEIHEHMIRSPPPTTWPRSPNSRMFSFPSSSDEENEITATHNKSPIRLSRFSLGANTQDSSTNGQHGQYGHQNVPSHGPNPIAIKHKSRKSSSRNHSSSYTGGDTNRFSLLSTSKIKSLSDVRRLCTRDDSVQLVSSGEDCI